MDNDQISDRIGRSPGPSWTHLEQQLQDAAAASRPVFSPDLQRRILAAVDSCRSEPARSPWHRLLARETKAIVSKGRPLTRFALAAALGGVLVAGWIASRWVFGPRSGGDNRVTAAAGQSISDLLAAEWIDLDDDAVGAAQWIVAELPIDLGIIEPPDVSSDGE